MTTTAAKGSSATVDRHGDGAGEPGAPTATLIGAGQWRDLHRAGEHHADRDGVGRRRHRCRADFYNGTTLLGSDTTAPYVFTWSNVAAGTYALKATAVDDDGATGSSATATVTVSSAASGLVVAYGLNEGTGTTVNDNSGNGETGTMSGAGWVAGRYGQALSLNGASSVVTFSDVDLTGSFTVMGWMQTRSLYSNACGSFVMKAFDYGFEVCGNLLARIGSGNGWNTYAMQPLSTADLNVWKHVAMTYDGTTVQLYIDGVLVDSATGAHVSNDNPLRFGRWTPASEYWDGVVDEVRIYNRTLSQGQTDMTAPVSGGTGNQAPTATLTAPANGATFTAPGEHHDRRRRRRTPKTHSPAWSSPAAHAAGRTRRRRTRSLDERRGRRDLLRATAVPITWVGRTRFRRSRQMTVNGGAQSPTVSITPPGEQRHVHRAGERHRDGDRRRSRGST